MDNTQVKEIMLPYSYSKSAVGRVWYGYSDIVLGTAGGYGYDKESAALCSAIKKLTGFVVDGYAAGWQSVQTNCKAYGLELIKLI